MIFWTEDIGEFNLSTGMKVIPILTTLKDGRVGFRLGSDKKISVESLGGTTEAITKDKIIIDTY